MTCPRYGRVPRPGLDKSEGSRPARLGVGRDPCGEREAAYSASWTPVPSSDGASSRLPRCSLRVRPAARHATPAARSTATTLIMLAVSAPVLASPSTVAPSMPARLSVRGFSETLSVYVDLVRPSALVAVMVA